MMASGPFVICCFFLILTVYCLTLWFKRTRIKSYEIVYPWTRNLRCYFINVSRIQNRYDKFKNENHTFKVNKSKT